MYAAAPLLLLLLLHSAAAVSEPLPTLTTGDFVPLDKWLKQRDLHACLSNTPADLLFVVDGSQSVGSSNFHLLMKSTLVDTISKFRIGARFTQVGVLVFSDQVSQVIPIGRYSSKLQLLSAISNLNYVDSYTSMEAAAEGCAAELQRRRVELNETSRDQALQSERKTVVAFLTDGWDNHGSSYYLRDLISQLHMQVSGVLALGLQNSNSQMLRQLASQPSLVFNPTTYPDFQAALLNLLNSHCAETCHKFEGQLEQAHRGISVTARYLNTITDNYKQLTRQQESLQMYVKQINSSAHFAGSEIRRICDSEDDRLLERIISVRKEIEEKRNSSETEGMEVSVFVTKMLQTLNDLQTEQLKESRELAIAKSRNMSVYAQEQKMRAELQVRLRGQISIRQTNENILKEMEQRILEQKKELIKMDMAISKSQSESELLIKRLSKQETEYKILLKKMDELTKVQTSIRAIRSSGEASFTEIEREIAFCKSYVRNFENVLFAIKCGSGVSFASIFSLDKSTFSNSSFNGLTNLGMYKSPYLKHMLTMGFFKEASMEFLIGGNVVAKLTADTSRYELANIFSQFHVISSFPYVASYINSVYRSSLSQFRLMHHTEFEIIYGDLAKYLETGRCEDLQGVFAVISKPHRCFPEIKEMPQVFIAASPYGGRMEIRVDEFRLVTSQPPVQKPLPTITTTDKNFIEETLVFVKPRAGILAPMLLSDSATSASVLLEVEEISQLARHYKNSLLNTIDINEFKEIEIQVFNAEKEVAARLVFKGPFGEAKHMAHSVSEHAHASWRWFNAKYLQSTEPFDIRRVRQARFQLYDGKQLLSIGVSMAADCEQREYFLTIVDGPSPCQCFKKVSTPAVFFSNGEAAKKCEKMQSASSLRIVGRFKMRKSE